MPNTMYVKMNRTIDGWQQGLVCEVPESTAFWMLKHNFADRVEQPKPAAKVVKAKIDNKKVKPMDEVTIDDKVVSSGPIEFKDWSDVEDEIDTNHPDYEG